MKVIGIDPGLSGGFALVEDGGLIHVDGVPIFKASGRGNDVDWASLSAAMLLTCDGADHCFIERVGARPGQGSSSMFKFGYTAGGVRGIIAVMNIPVTLVVPGKWKKAMGLSASKDAAVARAADLFPTHATAFRGPKGGLRDGLAEAALIAKYGYDTLVLR